jgi:leucine-zipper of insertion element IS481
MTQAAEAAGVSVRCARKWVGRYRAEGEPGLRDRSSAPRRIPHRTGEQRVQAIAALRRVRFTGPEIAEVLDMPLSTVSGILTRTGMGKLGRLGLEPAVRYERERPGELIHIDIKRLGRIQHGAGCRFTGPAARSKRPTRKDPLGVNRQTAAGNAYTSQSMTAHDWPTPRSWAIRTGARSSAFSDEPLRSTPATPSPCSGS